MTTDTDEKLIADLNLGPRETRYLTTLIRTSGRSLGDVITEALHVSTTAENWTLIDA